MRSVSRRSGGFAPGCAANFLDQDRTQPVDLQRNGAARLGDEIDRAELDGLQRRLGAFFCQRRDHHHRSRRFDHDLAEAVQPVHAGHLDVERHDLRIERPHELKRLGSVARQPNFEIAFLAENAFEQLPHQRGIVGDEELDHEAFDACSRPARSNLASTSASI